MSAVAKKYLTEGRTLYNYRGRTGRLTLVPTTKAAKGWAACDTFGTASRVLEAIFDPDVVSLGTEPPINVPSAATGTVHLDVREQRRSGKSNFVEVKAEQFAAKPDVVKRLLETRERIEKTGDSFEFVLRDEVVERVKDKALQFLYRYRNDAWQPTPEQQEQVRSMCCSGDVQSRTRWLVAFHAEGLSAAAFYWALARGYLELAGTTALFPDGLVCGRSK